MDAKSLIEQLLNAGKDLAKKGQTIAEDKLDIPEAGESRDNRMTGLKQGAAVAGVLALLLGTKTGRSVTGSALKIGSVAAVGGLAYQAYKKWKGNQENNASQQVEALSVDQLPDDDAEKRSRVLLKAMISASKADGHISDEEKVVLNQQFLDLGVQAGLSDLIGQTEADPKAIAALADNEEMAAEIYVVSSLVLDKTIPADIEYRKQLVELLGLPQDLLDSLDEAL